MKTCPSCGGKMKSIGSFPLPKGRAGAFLGIWNNVLEGALDVRAFCCESCRKREFYLADEGEGEDMREGDHMAQAECPFCYQLHDLDDAICPHCGRRLMD